MRMVTEAFRVAERVSWRTAPRSRRLGFLLQDVRARVRLWQGDDDRTVAPVHAAI